MGPDAEDANHPISKSFALSPLIGSTDQAGSRGLSPGAGCLFEPAPSPGILGDSCCGAAPHQLDLEFGRGVCQASSRGASSVLSGCLAFIVEDRSGGNIYARFSHCE